MRILLTGKKLLLASRERRSGRGTRGGDAGAAAAAAAADHGLEVGGFAGAAQGQADLGGGGGGAGAAGLGAGGGGVGGALEHLRDAGARERRGRGAVWGVGLLEGVEFDEEGVQGAEVVERVRRVEVEDGGQGEAQEEVVGRASGEFAGVEVGHFGEVGLGEEEGVEPVDAAFVAGGGVSLWGLLGRGGWIDVLTLCADSPA